MSKIKNDKNISSSAVLDITRWSPSSEIRAVADKLKKLDLNKAWVMKLMRATEARPNKAALNRHPKGLSPKV